MTETAKPRRRGVLREGAPAGPAAGGSAATCLVLGGIGLAAGLGYFVGEQRAQRPPAEPTRSAAAPRQLLVGETVDLAKATSLFDLAREVVAGGQPEPPPPTDASLRLSMVVLRRPSGSVRIAFGSGPSAEAAVILGTRRALDGAQAPAELSPFRIDLLSSLEGEEPFAPGQKLAMGDELGLVALLLPEVNEWVMPDEILAQKLFSESDLAVDPGDVVGYVRSTRPGAGQINPNVARRARFDSYLAREGRAVPLYRGNPPPRDLDGERLLQAATSAGQYLLRHQRPDGSFDYVYQPWMNDVGRGYNVLRHAGTCYALYELARETGQAAFADAADRGLSWLFEKHSLLLNADSELAIVDQDEAKLGGAALALLATVQAHRATPSPDRLEKARKLARYILSQQEDSGRFIAKVSAITQDPDEFESAYYPGEAIFALMRLNGVDPNPAWLAAAEKGARFLIQVRDANKTDAELDHDHWLLMGIEELHRSTEKPLYLEHAIRIGNAIVAAMNTGPYPDWEGSFYKPPRATPAATRLEGLVALVRTLERASEYTDEYRVALDQITRFVLRCQITDETSFFYTSSSGALGGIRKSLTSNSVRIDYVQHAISGFLGVRGLLRAQ